MVQRAHGALVTRARRGESHAQFRLALLYLEGTGGLTRNETVAFDWLLKAARQYHPEAASTLIRAGSIDAVLASAQRRELTDLYRQRAEAGEPLARWSYARLLEQSSIGQSDKSEAPIEHLEALANHGHRAAQWRMSQHEFGRKRRFKAGYWAERAAERGSAEALTWLASTEAGVQAAVLDQMSERFIRRLLRQDRELSAEALPLLFLFWRSGQGDSELRLAALEAAAQAGHIEAQFERALSLLDVAQILRNRVRREDARALSRIVEDRALPLQDAAHLSKAVAFFELAAASDHADACYLLGIVYRSTALAQRNLARSDQFFEKAAELGQADAQFWLGNKLWRERDRAPGLDVAGLAWLARAAARGNEDAHLMLLEHTQSVDHNAHHPHLQLSPAAIERLQRSEPLLAARVVLAQAFGLSRLETLLLDPVLAYHDSLLVIDLTASTPRHKRRVLRITSPEQRTALGHAVMLFRGATPSQLLDQGDYRRRLYRLEKALQGDPAKHERAVAKMTKTTPQA
jgi:TPR repeat protein